MNMAPDLEMTLTDWNEDPVQAFEDAHRAMTDVDTMAEMIDNIWYDFYRTEPKLYLENVVKVTGLQGKLVPQQDGVTFLVLYDVGAIQSVDIL